MSFRTQLYPVGGQPADPGRQAVHGHRFSRSRFFKVHHQPRSVRRPGGKGNLLFQKLDLLNRGFLEHHMSGLRLHQEASRHRKGRPVHVPAVFHRRRKGAHQIGTIGFPDLVVHWLHHSSYNHSSFCGCDLDQLSGIGGKQFIPAVFRLGDDFLHLAADQFPDGNSLLCGKPE